jgi:hypothetical protein
LHWIAQAEDLAAEVSSFKSYTAKMLVQYFEAQGIEKILQQFHFCKKIINKTGNIKFGKKVRIHNYCKTPRCCDKK